ncbi:MAG: response regulator transcription factor [Clostridia bacterium]|nr:response regulator transcription factor [Clostridia bacterium]
MYKILIVEDDSTISVIIAESLRKWGFEAELAADYSNILSDFNSQQPHLVLMDINLPYYDGFYWCEKIRNISNVPIIFISSRTDDNDKIRGIIGGGDDYIEKPFSIEMLITKIKAMLRRAYSYLDMSYTTISYGDIILDIEKSVISCGKESAELTHNECQIMSMLIKASGKIVSRSKIMKYLWDNENFIDENTLTVNINRIRNKLKNITERELIITVKGKGHKLNEN